MIRKPLKKMKNMKLKKKCDLRDQLTFVDTDDKSPDNDVNLNRCTPKSDAVTISKQQRWSSNSNDKLD